MDCSLKSLIKIKIDNVISALEKNNMAGIYAPTCADAVKEVEKLLNIGDTVSMGGTVSAIESGVAELIKSEKYNFLDRSAPNLTPEQIHEIYRKTFSANAFITSTNAITENGELYNVDGNSNRVAAMLFGPDKVIVIAGYNKIVRNIDEAVHRVKELAAPANCVRLAKETYCSKNGRCVSLSGNSSYICDGCTSEDRICCNYTIMSRQRKKGRVIVILVGEELGF